MACQAVRRKFRLPIGRLGEATLSELGVPQSRRVGFKPAAHFVTDPAEDRQNLLFAARRLRRVNKRPVMPVHLAGKNRAGLVQITADGDDGVNRLVQKLLEVF